MSYMNHSEGCTCTECVVMRNETPPAPVAQPVHEQQTIELGDTPPGSGASPALWPLQVAITTIVPLPDLYWPIMKIMGAGQITLAAHGEVVALIVMDMRTSERFAVWWDRNERKMRTAIAVASETQIATWARG